LGSQHL